MNTDPKQTHIAFIGGGNMASAIIGGLLKSGINPAQIQVVEPFEEARAKLASLWGVRATPDATSALQTAQTVVWAVKPQTFKAAAQQSAEHTQRALHLSVAAGITSSSIAGWLQTERVVRAMPNTPALVGLGMTGLFARPAVQEADKAAVEQVLKATGALMWLEAEAQLDAVTAISGSGPAYVFYFLEALARAGSEMGLSSAQAKQLALQTFAGATALAQSSADDLATLRQNVTSKGGTTYAAITHMQSADVSGHIAAAAHAACTRAAELGVEFGS